ncbi:hypothetical protein [Brevibacterium otitidis]|uniref:Uncharacterized protein n=1 Tax=Brevibacterium otitidis TaxID=53364 RepID=A0ABV5X2F7_9MICO
MGGALLVPLSATVPAASAPAAEAVAGSSAGPTGADAAASETPTFSDPPEVPSPDPTNLQLPTSTDTPGEDDGTLIKGVGRYDAKAGTVQFVRADDRTPLTNELILGTFDCNIEGLSACAVDGNGFLIVAGSSLPQPAAAGKPPGPGEQITFRTDPKITFDLGPDGALSVTSPQVPSDSLGDPGPSPTPSSSPSASPSPSQEPSSGPPSQEPTSGPPSQEPSQEPTQRPGPKPTDKAPDDDDKGGSGSRDDDSDRKDESRESRPPNSLDDPNNGNGQQSDRLPDQAGDDWAPTGDGDDSRTHNYADPVPQAPGSGAADGEDTISADHPGDGATSRANSTAPGQADREAADLASAAGPAWAIGGLVGIAAIAAGLVFFVLGGNRRRH